MPAKSPGVAPALALPPALVDGAEAVVERGVEDDRDNLGDQPFVLIVEDDPTFAGILLDVAHDASLKGVISSAGSGTLAMVRKMRPSAITLDLGLSDIDGFVAATNWCSCSDRSPSPSAASAGDAEVWRARPTRPHRRTVRSS